MAIARLGPNGEVEIIEPGTPEEAAEAWEKVLEIAGLLGRMAAKQDYDAAVAEARARREANLATDRPDG